MLRLGLAMTTNRTMPRLPKNAQTKVQHWDDERSSGNSLIVTLHYGWSFSSQEHEGVRGFDTVAEAKQAIGWADPCECALCERNKG